MRGLTVIARLKDLTNWAVTMLTIEKISPVCILKCNFHGTAFPLRRKMFVSMLFKSKRK